MANTKVLPGIYIDACIEIDFDADIGSSPELTDPHNRSEHTGSFLIQDVPGHPETDPSTRDCFCFQIFHVINMNVGSDF